MNQSKRVAYLQRAKSTNGVGVESEGHSHTFRYSDTSDLITQLEALLSALRRPRMRPFAEVRSNYPNLSDTAFYNRLGRFKGKIEKEMSPTGTRTVALYVSPELDAWLRKPESIERCTGASSASITRDFIDEKIVSLLKDVMSGHRDKESPDYNDCENAPCHWCEEAAFVLRNLS